jgi:GNAT superfamily N-acetyltransferase
MVGQVGYYLFDTIGEIDEFYVLPSHQKQGIGKALFSQTIQHLRKRGAQHIMLVTDPTSATYQIYKHWGFNEVVSLFQTRIKD